MKKITQLTLMALMLASAGTANAQFLRTSYFMEGSHYRMQLNPALAPEKGFVNIPSIGNINASAWSNSLNIDDMVDIGKNSDDGDYFTGDKFFNKLKPTNSLLLNYGTDIIAAGWWRGRNFWSFNVGVKVDGGANITKDLFSFMRDMNGVNTIDYSNYTCNFSDQELNINAYTELALGYTRQINDKLSIGGRLKMLLGIGNLNLKVNKATVNTAFKGVDPNINWRRTNYDDLKGITGTADIDVTADLEYSFKGLNMLTNPEGFIDEFKFESKDLGVAGCGAAIDLGASYLVTDRLTISGALLDLGYIKWSSSSSSTAHANTDDLHFNSANPNDIERFADIVGKGEVLNYDLLHLTVDPNGANSRTTSLAASLVLGGDYAINDMMRAGILFTERLSKPKSQTELTFSFNVHPKSYLDFTFSYSPIMSSGKSFGLGMKLGLIFIGTDYMFLGSGTRCCNALVGFSVPLSGGKS